jgi:hypothetical protein
MALRRKLYAVKRSADMTAGHQANFYDSDMNFENYLHRITKNGAKAELEK